MPQGVTFLGKSSPAEQKRGATEAKGLEGKWVRTRHYTRGKTNKLEIASEIGRKKKCCLLLWE